MMWYQKYIGIPFVDNGRSFAGCDCGGLAWLIYTTELKKELPCVIDSYSINHFKSCNENIKVIIKNYFKYTTEPKAFCLATFGRSFGDYHVGVFIDELSILHCKNGEHSKIVLLEDMPEFSDYKGAYEIL